jgi:hypothetical protein
MVFRITHLEFFFFFFFLIMKFILVVFAYECRLIKSKHITK